MSTASFSAQWGKLLTQSYPDLILLSVNMTPRCAIYSNAFPPDTCVWRELLYVICWIPFVFICQNFDWDNSFPWRSLGAKRPERDEESCCWHGPYFSTTIPLRLGTLVLEWELSSWGSWTCNRSTDRSVYGTGGLYCLLNRKDPCILLSARWRIHAAWSV